MNAPVLNHSQHNQAPSCHGGLENLDDEHDYWIEDVTGSVPEALRGTFFRNGPGRQRIGGKHDAGVGPPRRHGGQRRTSCEDGHHFRGDALPHALGLEPLPRVHAGWHTVGLANR